MAIYNEELERLAKEGKGTWFTAPWLYAEYACILSHSDHVFTSCRCYLYRLLRSHFATTKYWKDYDPFRTQKDDTFQASGTAIYSKSSMWRDVVCG